GTNPKLTISASESNCLPKSVNVLVKRAAKPSKKSATNDRRVQMGTSSKSPLNTNTTARHPANRFISVSKLGRLKSDQKLTGKCYLLFIKSSISSASIGMLAIKSVGLPLV